MKEVKKAMVYMALGAMATTGVMCLMNSNNKVNDLKQKECSMMEKMKNIFK